MSTSTVQYIDWDTEFAAAVKIAENAPGSSMAIDTGDLYEASAPCGCWVAYACSHPSAVGLCKKHITEMPKPLIFVEDWEEPSCADGAQHTWEPTDTQGHEMQCTTCGAEWRANI